MRALRGLTVLVLPPNLTLDVFHVLSRGRWWFSNFGDEISCACFCYAVDENAKKWDLYHDCESNAESEQHPTSIHEPNLLLLFAESDSVEIWLEQLLHKRPGRKVRLQERDHKALRHDQATREYDACRDRSNTLVEGPERCSWQDEATNARNKSE